MIGLLLAMLAGAPEDYPSLRIMDSEHRYEWVQVVEKDGLKVWWDRNARGTVWFEHREYPAILLRLHTPPGKFAMQSDMVKAVDCAANTTATTKGYYPWRKGEVEQDLTFRPWPDPDEEGIRMLMREVCAEGWGK